MNALTRLSAQFARQADRPFLLDDLQGREYTYRDSHAFACRLALGLQRFGVARGARVGLILPNSAEFAHLYLACLFLGAVAVPINPALHPREIAFILGHAGLTHLLYAPGTERLVDRAALAGARARAVQIIPRGETLNAGPGTAEADSFWTLDDADASDTARDGASRRRWSPLDGVTPDDLFTITFTSGTTSLPKAVPHRVGSLLENAEAFNELLGFDASVRMLHVLPMAYMAGFLNTLLCPLVAGGSVVLARQFDAQAALNFWRPVLRHEPTACWMAPTMLAALERLDRDPAGPSFCREHQPVICVGTAPLPRKLKEDWERKYGVELFESYGLSELLFVSANSPRRTRRPGSVGPLLEGVSVQVMSELGDAAAPGEDGEIVVRTPYVMAGYLNYDTGEPEALAHNAGFATGDVGHVDTEGNLFVTARKKDLIIRGGVNVSPRAVEDVLAEHPAVLQAAVIGTPHPFYGEEVAAVLQLRSGYALEGVRTSLEGLCRERLAAVAVPTRWEQRETLPTNANGKLQKARLREELIGSTGLVSA